MGNTQYKSQRMLDNNDKEEDEMIQSYTNELKYNRLSKDKVKDKITKFMSIYKNSGREFIKLKEYIKYNL